MSTALSAPIVIGSGLAGLVVGSFLNVVIHRLPRGLSIVRPRSRCPDCGRPIPAWENVPVLSYLWLRGRCRGCGHRISPRYPLVESLTALLFVAVALRYGLRAEFAARAGFVALLLAAAAIDLEHRIVPDALSLGGLALGVLGLPLAALVDGESARFALTRALLGAGAGFLVLWSIGFVHARISVALGRRFPHWPEPGAPPPRPSELDYWIWFPGMGFGDIKLMAAIGAFVGPLGVAATLLIASLVGLVQGLLAAALRRRLDLPFGFAPALAAGALVVLLAPGVLLGLPLR